MYYKDSPYEQASYPHQAYGTQQQSVRAPLLPQGYNSDMMYGNVMDTVKGYFGNPWVIVTIAILVVILIAWIMSSGKENYRHY